MKHRFKVLRRKGYPTHLHATVTGDGAYSRVCDLGAPHFGHFDIFPAASADATILRSLEGTEGFERSDWEVCLVEVVLP